MFYDIGKEAQLTMKLIPQTTVVKLDVGGTLIKTTLDALLAEPSSLLYLMFEPMVQGGEPVNAAAARSAAGALSEAVPYQYGGRPGPCRAKGNLLHRQQRDQLRYIVDYLRSLSRAPHGMMEPEPEGADAPVACLPALPDSLGGRTQLALDAQHFELRVLADACAARPAGGVPYQCHSLASLVDASGPGVTLIDILALSDADVVVLLRELSVNVVMSARIKAEIAAERAKRQAEREAERAVQAFRAALAGVKCPISKAGARVLHALGIAVGDLVEMDAAAAQLIGVSAEDAQLIAALERAPGVECPYPGAPFGEGGVLHCIGTDHGRRAWVNPHTDGKVAAAAISSMQGGVGGTAPHKFVESSDDGNCYTDNLANSWMSVDLGAARTVVPTHFCLRNDSGASQATYALRNWTLEGKAANAGAEDWQQLRKHDNDETLAQQKFSLGAWPVDAGGRPSATSASASTARMPSPLRI